MHQQLLSDYIQAIETVEMQTLLRQLAEDVAYGQMAVGKSNRLRCVPFRGVTRWRAAVWEHSTSCPKDTT